MFAIAGIVLLLVAALLRPASFVGGLPPLTPVAAGAALALFGLAIDLKLRKSQLVVAPVLLPALALGGWLALRTPPIPPLVALVLLFLLAHGVQRFAALRTVSYTFVLLAGALGAIAVGGRALPGAGAVADDDALALALVVAVSLTPALRLRSGPLGRSFLSILSLLLVGVCVFVTRSHAGLVALAAVIAVHLAARAGVRALVLAAAAAVIAAPIWLFAAVPAGALAGAPAAASAVAPAVALALAAVALYASFAVVVVILRRYDGDAEAASARAWAQVLLAALAGFALGGPLAGDPLAVAIPAAVVVGLVGALYQATHAHDPQLRVRFW